jgi:hypothetical protein
MYRIRSWLALMGSLILYSGADSSLAAQSAKRPPRVDKCLLNWANSGYPRDEQPSAAVSIVPAPSGSTQLCGRSSSVILRSYANPQNQVVVTAGGKTFRFVPLALYDKFPGEYCDNIKIRNACYKLEGDDTVRLYDKDTASKGFAVFTVRPDGRALVDGRESGISREFALIKADATNINGIGDRINAFRSKARSCGAQGQAQKCLDGLLAAAEDAVLSRVRQQRFPKLNKDDKEVQDDRQQIQELAATLPDDAKLIHKMMMLNELGPDSPYELSDAGIAKSGLSFGVRQLDIANNSDAKTIFNRNIADFATAPEWADLPAHKRFVYGSSIAVPVRKYTVPQLALLHEVIPTLDRAMRKERAKGRYNAHHREYLDQAVQKYAKLRKECLYKDSRYLALAQIDRDNQNPTDFGQPLRAFMAQACREGKSVVQVERDVSRMYGSYIDRWKNIVSLFK